MQLFFSGKFETSRFGHRHEITKMSEFQRSPLPKKHNASAYKVVLCSVGWRLCSEGI